MAYIPSYQRRLTWVSILVILGSCAGYSTTQQNLKKVNDAFEIKKSAPLTTPAPEEPKKDTPIVPGSMPLSQFLDAKSPTTIQSTNPWFSRVQDWSRTYVEIAKSERDSRNYALSEKYSVLAVLWADRAIQIKNFSTAQALQSVDVWMKELSFPKLPDTQKYYMAQDTYQKIATTKNILQNLQNRSCLVVQGVPFISSLGYLDLSIDLFKQKKYSKAFYKIQSALGPIENLTSEDDRKCLDSNEIGLNDLK